MQAAAETSLDLELLHDPVAKLEFLAADSAQQALAAAQAAEAAEADSDDEPSSFASLFTEESESEVEEEIEESLLIKNCGLSQVTVDALQARGIKAMFPIQKQVFEPAMAGTDLIARAKTGSGKTLAFALPVIEKIMANRAQGDIQGVKGRGRPPQCLVLAPTRELAKQVEREFTSVAPTLFVGCYYGGAAIGPQLRELQRGVDVAVGTPGRIIDLIDQNALDLSHVRFVVLDEADQMLNVGFEQDVETILENVPAQRHTMLFSATVPKWVRKLVKQHLNNPVDIDLVGEGQSGKMADSITAMAVQVTDNSRRSILVDVLTVYRDGGKAIVFTQTKRDADEVAAAVALHMPCEPLHGDMAQQERERVLAGFRAGRTSVLVATDVAARGLDIPDVDLVVHYELPRDPEAFLHRSGRTGRAGRSGTAIAMYTSREIGYFKRILRETETSNVTVIQAPNPRQVVEAAAKEVMYRLDDVDEEVRSYFAPVASTVLASKDPHDALVAALAALSGIKSIPEPRSLLTMQEGYVTLQMMSAPGRIVKPGNVAAIVSRLLGSSDKAGQVGRIRMLGDDASRQSGAAFDVPKSLADEILAETEELEKRGVSLTVPAALPPEEGLYDPAPRGRGGRSRDDDRDFFEQRRRGSGGGGRGGGGGGRGGGGGGRFRDGGSRDSFQRKGGKSFESRGGDRSFERGSDGRRGGGREGGFSRGWDFENGGNGSGRRGGKVFGRDQDSW